MKAFLLAAGLGTRLRPITDIVPKCLVEICGKPLLQWWIELFEQHGITDALINTHHLHQQVEDFIKSSNSGIKFEIFHEEVLLGSASTIRENRKFVENENCFLIAYADNLTNCNLSAVKNFHRSKDSTFTMTLFKTDTPRTKGIVEMEKNKKVISFQEKPEDPKSNLANAGIYFANPNVIDLIPRNRFADIGFDLLPKLVDKMYGWEIEDYLIDIGTKEHLNRAEMDWRLIQKGEQNGV